MPVVKDGSLERPRSEAHERARKIDPVYAEGPLVRVAGGRNQAEAELIQNLLLEQGVPSLLKRSAGFDVPDFLAAGPRDVLVPESGVEAAREMLLQSELAPREDYGPGPRLWVLIVTILVGCGAATLIAWIVQNGI